MKGAAKAGNACLSVAACPCRSPCHAPSPSAAGSEDPVLMQYYHPAHAVVPSESEDPVLMQYHHYCPCSSTIRIRGSDADAVLPCPLRVPQDPRIRCWRTWNPWWPCSSSTTTHPTAAGKSVAPPAFPFLFRQVFLFFLGAPARSAGSVLAGSSARRRHSSSSRHSVLVSG